MTTVGAVVIVAGLAAIGLGGWSAINVRRPPWLTERSVPRGRERQWGLAMTLLGCGVVALGLFWVSDLFGALGILGALLIFLGVGFLVIAVGSGSSSR